MQHDFIRVSVPIECTMGVPLDWLCSCSPVLQLTIFKARCGHRKVLYRGESTTMLALRWTAAHHVPRPTEGIR